jgi:hypothetical protein
MFRPLTFLALSAALFACPASALSAQVLQPVPGLPFQVITTDNVRHVGTFGSADELAVRLRRAHGEEVEFLRPDVLDTRVRTSRGGRGWSTFGWVVASSALGLGTLGALSWEPCEGWCVLQPKTRGSAFIGSALVGGIVVGIPVGAVAGLLRVSAWESAPPAEWTLPEPAPSGGPR